LLPSGVLCCPEAISKCPVERSRIEILREMLAAKPEDTFARYALALELAKSDRPADAGEHFDYLLKNHPQYSATYYQAGMFLLNQGHREEAKEVFTKGVEVTRRQGNRHAQSELERVLDELAAET
jgi:tetratricopeptide (TPR) repeat protein